MLKREKQEIVEIKRRLGIFDDIKLSTGEVLLLARLEIDLEGKRIWTPEDRLEIAGRLFLELCKLLRQLHKGDAYTDHTEEKQELEIFESLRSKLSRKLNLPNYGMKELREDAVKERRAQGLPDMPELPGTEESKPHREAEIRSLEEPDGDGQDGTGERDIESYDEYLSEFEGD